LFVRFRAWAAAQLPKTIMSPRRGEMRPPLALRNRNASTSAAQGMPAWPLWLPNDEDRVDLGVPMCDEPAHARPVEPFDHREHHWRRHH
jgi:hypothetical protein